MTTRPSLALLKHIVLIIASKIPQKYIMLKNVVLWHMPTTNISQPTQFFWHENLPRGD